MRLPIYTPLILFFMLNSAMGYKTPIAEASNHNLFAADLFSTLVEEKSSKNIIFSPVSIQTALGLTFLGAKGDTAEEMRKVLRLGQGDKTRVAENFGDFVRTLSKKQKTTESDAPQLAIANRIYVAEGHRIAPEFNRIALEHFDAEAENVDFYNNEKARYTINKFVEEQTENKIRDLVKPGVLDSDTAMVLVNAIYYKGKWKYPFDTRRTNEQDFNINTKIQQKVKFMINEILLNYAELPELNAKVLELPYNNSDITMMLILPNAIEGLEALETKLKNMDLNVLSEKLSEKYIRVYLPKFRLEHEVDLKEPLMKMGLSSIFSTNANLRGLLASHASLYVSKAVHKAFLDVDEYGSEAAAATYAVASLFSSPVIASEFRADRPFVFAIRNKSAVYFAGHVSGF